MKRSIKTIFGAASLMLLAVGCSDDFLVEKPTGATITSEQFADAVEYNPKLGEGIINGIYTTMFETGTGGTGGHDDFGQKGYDIFADMLSGDMALSLSTYGWYRSSFSDLQVGTDFTFTDNYQVWRYYYRIINYSNLAIDGFGGSDADPEDPTNRYSLGQALAMRAHSYFYLTQYLINDVEAQWTQPTLPVYTTATPIGAAKSTTEEVYNLMEADLTRAIELLDGFQRNAKSKVNKPIAQTILAYVLASRRDRWADVATLTQEALDGTSATLASQEELTGGFNDVSNASWMWGVDLNADIALGLVSWWGQIDAFSYSYAAYGDNKAMDAGLYESMRPDDIRRNQYYDDNTSTRYLQPLFKFYDSDRQLAGSSQIVKADYVYMRYEEPLLLNIEALAKSGQEPQAVAKLFDFVSTRTTDASYVNALSGQDLLDEIYMQTRWELWGEGKAYLALKRNKETVVRGSNHLSLVGQPISFDDERLSFEIPQQEIQDNLFINDQN